MSFNSFQRIGGAHIIPSKRPPIHGYGLNSIKSSDQVVNEDMVGYKAEDSEDSSNEPGVDEVDNILSKPAASPINRIRRQRRNSLPSEQRVNRDDINNLSKSLPENPPSLLYCSDDSEDEIAWRPNNVSNEYLRAQNRSDRDLNLSRRCSVASHSSLDSSQILSERNQAQTLNKSSKITILSLIGVFAAICVSMMNTSQFSNTVPYDELQFNMDTSSVGEKYNVDENSILQVQTGISTIIKREDTGSFMFVYDSDANNFNQAEFNKFVNDISYAASKYLRNDSTPVHYTLVEGTKLDMEEHGELISRYKWDLTRSGVMVVRHIEAVPASLAMAFHYYCDEYNPLVKKSAIFFTLNLADCKLDSDRKSSHASIEKCLQKKWSSIPADSIGPLLTRVVSIVIDVTSVF